MTIKSLNVLAVRTDGDTQSRVGLNTEVVDDYAEKLTGGDPGSPFNFPPIIVYFDGSDHWLADGFHRLHAYIKATRVTIQAEVRMGTQRDARLAACGANSMHGLRRSNSDKRRAVGLMLADPEWSKMSDRVIAKHCGVEHHLVGSIRRPKAEEPVTGGATGGGTPTPKKPPAEPKQEKITPPPAPPPAPTEAEKVAEDAHGGVDVVDALAETQASLETLQREFAAATADDKGAELVKWQRIADVAQRRRDELVGELKTKEDLLTKATKTIARIGRAVGEDDPSKVAATVEMLMKSFRVGA